MILPVIVVCAVCGGLFVFGGTLMGSGVLLAIGYLFWSVSLFNLALASLRFLRGLREMR